MSSETDSTSLDGRLCVSRGNVVDVVQSVEMRLSDDERAFTRASQLETSRDLTAYSVGTILGLLADDSERVAEHYSVPEARRIEVSRWGKSGGTTQWEVAWHD